MLMEITKSQFHDAFKSHDRENQFSYSALDALFDYLDEDETFRLDVIEVCCTYSESTLEEFADSYSVECERELLAGWYVRDNKDKMQYIGVDEPAFNRMDNEDFLDLMGIIITESVCCYINDENELEQLRDEFDCKGTGEYIDLEQAVTDYIDNHGGWYQVIGDSIVYLAF